MPDINYLYIYKVIATVELGVCFLLKDKEGVEYVCPIASEALTQIPEAIKNAKASIDMMENAKKAGTAVINTTLQ